MAEEMSNPTLTTILFKLSDDIDINSINRLSFIGPNILVHCNENSREELKKSFTSNGFTVIPRNYKLHVSTKDDEQFKKVFSETTLEYESRSNDGNRFIATVTVNSQEEYDRYLSLDSEECRIKPYKHQYASINRSADQDNGKGFRYGKGGKGKGGKGKGGKGNYDDRNQQTQRRNYDDN